MPKLVGGKGWESKDGIKLLTRISDIEDIHNDIGDLKQTPRGSQGLFYQLDIGMLQHTSRAEVLHRSQCSILKPQDFLCQKQS